MAKAVGNCNTNKKKIHLTIENIKIVSKRKFHTNPTCLMLNNIRPCPLRCLFFESNEPSEIYKTIRLEVLFKFEGIFFYKFLFSKSFCIVSNFFFFPKQILLKYRYY